MRTTTLLELRTETVERVIAKIEPADPELAERIRALLDGGAVEREVALLLLIEDLLALQGRVEELEAQPRSTKRGTRKSKSKAKASE